MTDFGEALRRVAERVPETRLLIVMGTDGIPIEKLARHDDPTLEAVAAEYTTLLRASLMTAADTGLGDLKELSVVTDSLAALLVGITSEYFLFAALGPGAVVGRARLALRLAASDLAEEFE